MNYLVADCKRNRTAGLDQAGRRGTIAIGLTV